MQPQPVNHVNTDFHITRWLGRFLGIARRRGQCLGQFIRRLLSLLFLALLLGFLSLIFDLGKVLQNAGCRLFAFLLILDQLVDLCGQIVLRLVGLTGLGVSALV